MTTEEGSLMTRERVSKRATSTERNASSLSIEDY